MARNLYWKSRKAQGRPPGTFKNYTLLIMLDCAGFSLVAASGGCSLVAVSRLLIVESLLLESTDCRALRLQLLWLPGSRAWAQ